MSVWAIADLHLAISDPLKLMDYFGEPWIHYTEKIKKNWNELVKAEDLVLIPGDISWAMKPEQAKIDLDWIHQLPGTKIMLRGNHDFWWTSLKQVEKILPPSIHVIQNNAWQWQDFCIGGTRLWDSTEYNFNPYIQFVKNERAKVLVEQVNDSAQNQTIFQRELARLELSLKEMNKKPGRRIVMTHYPPISADLQESSSALMLEKYNVSLCVFGHLHNVKKEMPMFGTRKGIPYILASADYIDFKPILIA